jgi:hypothetical protein
MFKTRRSAAVRLGGGTCLVGSLAIALATGAALAADVSPVNVEAWRSGFALPEPVARVTICHVPPGNPDEVHLITVGAPAVAAHLAKHGDAVCAGDNRDCCVAPDGAVCTSLMTDANNCGACGHHCGDFEACQFGVCVPVSPCTNFVGEGCYWMENDSGNYCWVPAGGFPLDVPTCQFLDSCSTGGGGGSGGGCYRWSTCSLCATVYPPWP